MFIRSLTPDNVSSATGGNSNGIVVNGNRDVDPAQLNLFPMGMT